MISVEQLVGAARSLQGIPYRHQGRTQAGLDCIGFVLLAMERAGAPVQSPRTNYGRLPEGELLAEVGKQCIEIEVPEPGTLILIRWPSGPFPCHGAICIGADLIHSYQTAGRVVLHGYREPWLRWTHSIYRLPGIAYP